MKAWREPRSDYYYRINSETDAIHIVDQNLGNMSVTNDAENVLAAIHKEIDLTDREVTYTDSEGQVDRLLHKAGEFTGFAPGPR